MTNTNTKKKRNTRSSGTVLEKGVFATAIGLIFLIAPWFFSASPGIVQIQAGLRLPGWLALGIGLALLGLHFARKSRANKIANTMGRNP